LFDLSVLSSDGFEINIIKNVSYRPTNSTLMRGVTILPSNLTVGA